MKNRTRRHYQIGYKRSTGLTFLLSRFGLHVTIVSRRYVMSVPGLRTRILAGMKGRFLQLSLTVGAITCIFTHWHPNVTELTARSRRILESGSGFPQFQL